jgi:hypothetical protein
MDVGLSGHGADEPVRVERWPDLLRLVQQSGPLHVVRGRCRPARGGGVQDEESGCLLPGVPVLTLTPARWWAGPLEDWVSRQLSHHLVGRSETTVVPLLRGREVDRGWDGEPLLASVQVVALVGPPALLRARRHHRSVAAGRWPSDRADPSVDALLPS